MHDHMPNYQPIPDLLDDLRELENRLYGQPGCAAVKRAIAEIERLRSIAGAATRGPSAAEVLAPLRHKAPSEFDRGFVDEWERQKVLIGENQERLAKAKSIDAPHD